MDKGGGIAGKTQMSFADGVDRKNLLRLWFVGSASFPVGFDDPGAHNKSLSSSNLY
jgi:hypothetical protein